MQMSLALLASLRKGLKLTLLPSAKLMFDYPKNVSVHLITVADECISCNLVRTQLCLCAHSRWVVIFFIKLVLSVCEGQPLIANLLTILCIKDVDLPSAGGLC